MGKLNKLSGDVFFDKILNKSCILQWENVVEICLESGDFRSCRVPLEISRFFFSFFSAIFGP